MDNMMPPAKVPPTPWGLASWITLGVVIMFGMLLSIAGYRYLQEARQKQASVDQMRRLQLSLRLYANDNGGYYPFMDPQWPTANAGFRMLAQEGILENEADLGALASPFRPDGDLGPVPDCPRFAEPGECHWMVIKQSGTTNDSREPLIFDNAIKAEWPPHWRANADGQPVRGRTLFGGKILIGFNDNTARFIKLVPSSPTPGADLILPTLPSPWFNPAVRSDPPKVADIEEKPAPK